MITRVPPGPMGLERVFGGISTAKEAGLEVIAYLLGDGVLLAKDGPIGKDVTEALANGVTVFASSKDLKARAVGRILDGVEQVVDLEGLFVEDAMERADKVITW